MEKVLPGVKVEVLGPPTFKQTDAIRKKRSRDPDEFWHFQVGATALAAGGDKKRTILFPRYVESRSYSHRINARWLVHHARTGNPVGERCHHGIQCAAPDGVPLFP